MFTSLYYLGNYLKQNAKRNNTYMDTKDEFPILNSKAQIFQRDVFHYNTCDDISMIVK